MFIGAAVLVGAGALWAYKTYWGGSAVNTVQPPRSRVYLRLRFRDPEGNVRDFPTGYPVCVRFGQGGGAVTVNRTVEAGGVVSFEARTDDPWGFFTLQFPAPDVPYFVCEPNLSPPAATADYRLAAGMNEALRSSRRFFSLPRTWEMPQADWSPPPVFAGNGRYASGLIFHTTSPPADISIGTAGNPVVLTLEPHWKYQRFEYYDRYFGDDSLDTPSRVGLKRRVAIPPIELRGLQNDPDAAASPPDTHSNWVIDPGGANDLKNIVQCLPWIVRRQPDQSALPAAFDGAHMGLRFDNISSVDANLVPVAYSADQNYRILHFEQPPANPLSPPGFLNPGPDRLRYYDLPRIWKSKNYFAGGVPNLPADASPPNGQFFSDLNVADLAQSDQAAQPLVFSLDDIVLADNTLNLINPGPTDQVSLFHHRFANRALSPPAGAPAMANLSNEGIYRPQMNPPVNLSPPVYPYSMIQRRKPYYITDYPDWTRLVATQGNLFDTFSERTPDGRDVVGARAAVRWVDATSTGVGWGAGTNIAGAARPALVSRPYFAIQPFYSQNYLSRSHNPVPGPIDYNEWNAPHASGFTNGRFDIAHIRCTDAYDGKEISVVMRYIRFFLDFAPAAQGNPYAGAPAGVDPGGRPTRFTWAQTFYRDVPNRWNGVDDPNSTQRPFIFTSPPSRPLLTHVLTVTQNLSPPQAHFRVQTIQTGGTSSMDAPGGTGVLRANSLPHDAGGGGNDAWGVVLSGRGLPAAHEVGHCGGMPDEYRPGPLNDEAGQYPLLWNYRSNHALGNPYGLENQGLMFYNWFIRARYLWHAAEWMRTIPGMQNDPLVVWRGATEQNYSLPFYRHAGQPGRTYTNWPFRFNLRQPPAGNGCFDAVLYRIGDDEYANTVLPNLVTNNRPIPRAPGDQMDGVLVIMPRVRFTFRDTVPNMLPAAWIAFMAQTIYSQVEQSFDNNLNGRYCAAFQSSGGATPPPPFQRCLLYFLPCFVTNDGGAGVNHNFANQAIAASVPHMNVDIILNGANNFVNAAPPGPKQQDLRLGNLAAMPGANQNAHLNAIAGRVFGACCSTLGLVNDPNPLTAGSYADPNSYINIVRTVMDPGGANPVIT